MALGPALLRGQHIDIRWDLLQILPYLLAKSAGQLESGFP
jgi:hypothetical protein